MSPFAKVNFMRLVSCSLYNSWHNLTRAGQTSFKTSGKDLSSDKIIPWQTLFKTSGGTPATLPQGHYTVESIAKEVATSLESFENVGSLKIETNQPNCVLKIARLTPTIPSEIKVSHDLAQLIGTSTTLGQLEYIKKLNSPSTYFIHCNLIDKN